MDIERALEFIAQDLAALTASQQQAEVRAARTERQILGLQALVKIGMRQLVKLGDSQKKLSDSHQKLAASHRQTQAELRDLSAVMRDLALSQKRTDQKFDRWLDSLKGGNGHKKGK